jgi:FKBP-type peptidyl-prolyl cis-trans isomerase
VNKATGVLAPAMLMVSLAASPGATSASTAAPGRPAPADVAAPSAGSRVAASGLASKVLQRSASKEKPLENDLVKVEVLGWTRDGRPVGGPEQPLRTVHSLPPGLAELVRSMAVGERRRAWIPARLMRAPGVDDDDAPPPVDFTFEVALLDMTRAPAVPRPLDRAPRAAERTSSGLGYQVLRRGKGIERPRLDSQVKILHTGWDRSGIVFESSVLAGRPIEYAVSQLPLGLREGLQLMQVGEKTRFWLPAPLAYPDGRRGAPVGPMVFDVELLSFE